MSDRAGDPYVYPGSSVLQNRAGLRDEGTLQDFERRITSLRASQLRESPIRGQFDVEHFKAIHQHLFQDVYRWAGQLRTVEIAKGETQFAAVRTPAHTLESWGGVLFDALKSESHLRGLDRERFVDRLTHHVSEVNYWHPFREGNGRTTREFFHQVAERAGYQLDFTRVQPQEWNAAAAAAEQTTRPMREVLGKITQSTRALAFDRDPRAEAILHHPELKGAYAALDRANSAAERFGDRSEAGRFVEERRQEISAILHTGRVLPDLVRQQEQEKTHEVAKNVHKGLER